MRYIPSDKSIYSDIVNDEDELVNWVDIALKFWFTSDHYVQELEKDD